MVWDREDYFKEASKQLGDDFSDFWGLCQSTDKNFKMIFFKDFNQGFIIIFYQNKRWIMFSWRILDLAGSICYPKSTRGFLMEWSFNVPGRLVISSSGYFTENISAFVDYHL